MNGPRYAVITTHNRPAELARCVIALAGQVDTVIVVDNASEPPAVDAWLQGQQPMLTCEIVFTDHPDSPPNLSRMWNIGLDVAAGHAQMAGHDTWDVAVLNDDAVVPAGWYEACTAAMRDSPAVVGCSDPYGSISAPLLRTEPDNHLMTRECPWAFVVRGESGLRSDETLRWWYFDTDLMWRARRAGGTVMIPGYLTQNTLANSTTVGELAEQAGRDRDRFAEIWGHVPW